MKSSLGRVLRLVIVMAVGACSESPAPLATLSSLPLESPQSVVLEAASCQRPPSTDMVGPSRVDGRCLRRFTGLDAAAPAGMWPMRPERRALAVTGAAAEPPTITITELFDWAEIAYVQFFPSRRSNLVLGPYTYRYYPETQNHVAVASGLVYIQGPISGGSLAYVGVMSEFACRVKPTQCGEPPPPAKDCTAPTSWLSEEASCEPNPGLPTTIASGRSVTFTDSAGRTNGSATFTCTDGSLATNGIPSCIELPPQPCDTSKLSWNEGQNVCAPNASDPKSLLHGRSYLFVDSSGTYGSAVFQCEDGNLRSVGAPSCLPAPGAECKLPGKDWRVANSFCQADSFPATLASSTSVTLKDTIGSPVGTITYTCLDGSLVINGTPICGDVIPGVQDSFGGDGGAADGGANGDGTAGDGKPIVGASVWAVDTTGKTVYAALPTDAQGYFRLKLTGMVPPLVLSVKRTDGVVRRSLSTQALKTNGYIFIAVTGLTDFIAGNVAQQVSGINSAAALTPAMIASKPEAVTAAVNVMKADQFVAEQLAAAGIPAETFNPLSAAFRANGTGYDKVLDNLVISVNNAGTTVIGPTYCLMPTSWTVGGLTCIPDEGSGRTIPSNQTVIVKDSVGSPRGSVGFSCLNGVLLKPVLPSCVP